MRVNASRISVFLGVLLLVGSLAANLWLGVALKASFVDLQSSRVFPLGHNEPDRQPPTGGVHHPSISFWGDSRARAWAQAPSTDPQSVLNFAHGAQTSSQLLLQLKTTPAIHTDYAVLQIGINDLHSLRALGAHKTQILQRLGDNIVEARDMLLQRANTVVLTTIFPPGRTPLLRRFAWDPETLRYIEQVNDLIRQASDGQRVLLVDGYVLLRDADDRLAARYVDDDFFLHVNPEAYAQLNARLQQVVTRSRK